MNAIKNIDYFLKIRNQLYITEYASMPYNKIKENE
jgi:hypothetical protein